jgi:hypothetical protein
MNTHGETHGTEDAPDRGERALAEEIEGLDPAELAQAAARFTRENPHAALAGALAVGFLLGGGLTPRLLVSLALFAGRRYAAQAMRETLEGAVTGAVEGEPAQA